MMQNTRMIYLATLFAVAVAAAAVARAAQFPLAPHADAIGALKSYTTKRSDTLLDVARRFDLGYTQLIAANRNVSAWAPGTGRRIKLPSFYILPYAPHEGIVVNLAEQRLFYYPPGGRTVETFPVGIGLNLNMTPLGTTRVVSKEANPTWYPPQSIRAEEPSLPGAVPPGPNDPLGDFALHLSWPSYLIHGTNLPDGIGRNVSHGCIRLYPEDIATLFHAVPVGTPVRVVNQPVEAGWIGNELYLEVHPNQQQTKTLDIDRSFKPSPPPELAAFVVAVAGNQLYRVHWSVVRLAGRERTGIPVRITMPPRGAPRVSASKADARPQH